MLCYLCNRLLTDEFRIKEILNNIFILSRERELLSIAPFQRIIIQIPLHSHKSLTNLFPPVWCDATGRRNEPSCMVEYTHSIHGHHDRQGAKRQSHRKGFQQQRTACRGSYRHPRRSEHQRHHGCNRCWCPGSVHHRQRRRIRRILLFRT
jgi:hypothetical protein